MPDPAPPLSADELAAIRRRSDRAMEWIAVPHLPGLAESAADVPRLLADLEAAREQAAPLLAENERLRAAVEVCAGEARSAFDKMHDAPCSAHEHLQTVAAVAAYVGVQLGPDRYSPAAGELRGEVWRVQWTKMRSGLAAGAETAPTEGTDG